jgi:hypothetical protein
MPARAIVAGRIVIDQLQEPSMSTDYRHTSVTLSAEQAAGTAPIVGANGRREVLRIKVPRACTMTTEPGMPGAIGLAAIGDFDNPFVGAECPIDRIYINGLAAGDVVIVTEGLTR